MKETLNPTQKGVKGTIGLPRYRGHEHKQSRETELVAIFPRGFLFLLVLAKG